MSKFFFFILGAWSSLAWALTPQEFEQLYTSKDKTAEVCYQLYQAYAQGDGTEQDDSRARKWLLAAHESGMVSARKEISELPWRTQAKLKRSIPIAEVGDDEARALGQELVQFMLDNGGRTLINSDGISSQKPSKKIMAEAKRLIAAGADLNVSIKEQKDFLAATALFLACKMGDAALADLLISHGADPNACGGLALMACYTRSDPEAAKKAWQEPSSPSSASAKMVKQAMERDTKQAKEQIKRAQKMFALLLQRGADVRMWSDLGWSPVYKAVDRHSPLGVRMLVKAGADPNQAQNPHEVAHHAYSKKNISYFTEGYGVTKEEVPLHAAAQQFKDRVVEVLMKSGADPNHADNQGETPLACAKKSLESLEAKTGKDRRPTLEKSTQAIISLMEKR